jgi:hypothetical protein
MTDDPQDQVLRLAEGLRDTRDALDAARAHVGAYGADRRRLARKVDLLSHLLISHGESSALDPAAAEQVDAVLGHGGSADASAAGDGGEPDDRT